jgi:hypothetical protein
MQTLENVFNIGNAPIKGAPTAQFNGSVIDLTTLLERDFHLDKAEFLYLTFLDLSTVDLDSDEYTQYGTRDDNKNVELKKLKTLSASFKAKGFVTTEELPIFIETEDGKLLPNEGRTRVKAAIANGEKVIPIAVYKYNGNQTEFLDEALLQNSKKMVSHKAEWQDYIKNGVRKLKEGTVSNTLASIEAWLVSVGFYNLNLESDTVKMYNAIQKRLIEETQGDVIRKTRADWEKFVTKECGIQLGDDGSVKRVMLNMDKKTYVWRAFMEHILPSSSKGKKVELILWTGTTSAQSAVDNLKTFLAELDLCWTRMYNTISMGSPEIMAIPSDKRAYTVIGAVPQLKDSRYHAVGNRLVPISVYGS